MLSPLLISIFINILTQYNIVILPPLRNYLQIYTTAAVSDISSAISKINSDLQTISNWSKLLKLCFKPNKSQVCIGNSNLNYVLF